jgi:hypothetical protein
MAVLMRGLQYLKWSIVLLAAGEKNQGDMGSRQD